MLCKPICTMFSVGMQSPPGEERWLVRRSCEHKWGRTQLRVLIWGNLIPFAAAFWCVWYSSIIQLKRIFCRFVSVLPLHYPFWASAKGCQTKCFFGSSWLFPILEISPRSRTCLGMSLEEHAIKHDTAFCDANLDPEEMSSQNAQYFSIRNCSKGCW